MINRENWKVISEFSDYLKNDKQLNYMTLKNINIGLRLLLNYANERPLEKLDGLRPSLPEYIATHKSEVTGKPLAVVTQQKALEHIRAFYAWARIYKRGSFARVRESWVDILRVKRSLVNASMERGEHEFWQYDDIMKVAGYEPKTFRDERTRAAILFLYLSGMRITAFVSLPVDCVDLSRRRVEQKPSKGVETKNRKAAVTFLLAIDELLNIVGEWDRKVKDAGAKHWFARGRKAESGDMEIDPIDNIKKFHSRRSLLDGDIRLLCERVGVPIKSAHKLRHAFAVYGIRHAKTVEEMKVVSQNLMHSNIGITDGIYGVLPEENMSRVIANLGNQEGGGDAGAFSDGDDMPEDFLKFAKMLYDQFKK